MSYDFSPGVVAGYFDVLIAGLITTIEFTAFGVPVAFGAVADAMGVAAGLACYAATAIALAVLVTRAPAACAPYEADRA